MEKSLENAQVCNALARRFIAIVRDQPRDRETMNLSMDALTGTLLSACSSPEVAAAVVNAVVENEERWPSPATIRRYMQELNYVEMDKRERAEAAYRREQDQRRAERQNEPPACDTETARRMDRLYNRLNQVDLKRYLEEICLCGNDPAKVEAVLQKYERYPEMLMKSSPQSLS